MNFYHEKLIEILPRNVLSVKISNLSFFFLMKSPLQVLTHPLSLADTFSNINSDINSALQILLVI